MTAAGRHPHLSFVASMTQDAPAAPGSPSEPARAQTGRFNRYVPRALLEHLADTPEKTVRSEDGTMLFVDISGFTKLSERLARTGREGAEHLVETISACFSALLAEAYANGGSLLKFGGDALLVWFSGDDHAPRACSSAIAMRRTLRQIGRVRAGASNIVLRMSVGVHSGRYELFLVGGSHREYLIGGPSVGALVALESAAQAGQILVSDQTAALLPERCRGARSEPGVLLARAPSTRLWMLRDAQASPPDADVALCLSTALRAHLSAAPAHPEHRTATVSFLQFGELDGLIAAEGAEAAAGAVDEVVRAAQEAADRYEVCILGSDIAADGGKLLFSAGAPRAIGDDEERMLLTMRHVIDAHTRLPVRAGITRGYVFTGEVGPPYRRTYAVMGDVVNLAARLAAKAPWREAYTIETVLARANDRFARSAVPPFMVKGKSRPIEAFSVGGVLRAAAPAGPAMRLPLSGRDAELATIVDAIERARTGSGAYIELSGENGSGKSRLLSEARERAGDMRAIRTICESYTRGVPYIHSREMLRQLLALRWDDPDEVVLAWLRDTVTAELEPWLPLLAIALGVEAPSTREVEELAADAREAKLHDVLTRFLADAFAVPTLLQVEHTELMDEASAALLEALAEHLPRSSWLIIATRHTPGESAHSTRIELGPLPDGAALALAEASPYADVLPPHTIALAVERAAGNPEFLVDLLAAAAGGSGELPESIEAAASARIDALDPGDRALIRRASLLGFQFRAARLIHVLEPDAVAPDERTWARLSSHLLPDSDGYLRFRSPILCEVAYTGLPFGLRRSLHLAVGEALERDVGADVDADPAVLSVHFSRAGDHARAWRYAVLGAERASARFAAADAARLYRTAIDAHRGAEIPEADVARVWESFGEVLMLVGENDEAERALDAARRLTLDDPVAQARICCRRGEIADRNDLSSAVRWLRRGLRALEQAPGLPARRWRARLIADLASIRQRQSRFREAERLCREALIEGEASGELRAQARASYILDWALFELGRFEEATHSARALEIYRELGDPEQEGRVLNNLGGLSYWQGRWQEAIELYREAGTCSERAGHAADVAFTDGNIGEILADQGRLEEAATHLRRARRVWSATADRQGTAFANMLLGRLAVRDGRGEEGLDLLRAALADMERFGVGFYAALTHALIAEGEALGGDAQRALALADEQLAGGSDEISLLTRVRGIALARLGDLDGAASALELAVAGARERGEDFDMALALDALVQIGRTSTPERTERDAILARLGVVALPAIPGLAAEFALVAGGEA